MLARGGGGVGSVSDVDLSSTSVSLSAVAMTGSVTSRMSGGGAAVTDGLPLMAADGSTIARTTLTDESNEPGGTSKNDEDEKCT